MPTRVPSNAPSWGVGGPDGEISGDRKRGIQLALKYTHGDGVFSTEKKTAWISLRNHLQETMVVIMENMWLSCKPIITNPFSMCKILHNEAGRDFIGLQLVMNDLCRTARVIKNEEKTEKT